MDLGKGIFEQVQAPDEETLKRLMGNWKTKHPQHGGWFRVGEVIEINGSFFRVKSVKPTELRLKLLPKGFTNGQKEE